jgi:hypothetical protein
MAKLINLIPNKELKKESIEDMDVTLPSKVDKFLERALQVIKSYSLTRKKEQLVMAKLVDALGMTPQDLAAAVQRLKKYKIAKK